MKAFFTQLGVAIVILVAGTIVGVLVERQRALEAGKLSYLDLRVQKRKDILSTPSIPSKRLDISLDGQKIASLSEVSVLLYNNSGHDFENVPIYITLKAPSDTTLQVVSEQTVAAHDLPEGVSKLPLTNAPQDSGDLRYGYEILVANRGSGLDSVFHATYLLLGDELPEVTVTSTKKGLELRRFSFDFRLPKSSYLRILVMPVGMMLLWVAISIFLWRRLKLQE